jgi:hypothetical protein
MTAIQLKSICRVPGTMSQAHMSYFIPIRNQAIQTIVFPSSRMKKLRFKEVK